ncbi:MAG: PKD domain-containing protein [Actinomycetota bacterium]|nr:PKD domain-containing protein [Actinomycetota bacterium]
MQNACLHLETRLADPGVAAALMSEVNAYDFANILAPCPKSQPAPAVPSPAAAAEMVWRDQMRLPPPEPYIAPGKGIPGLAAFLEIRGPRARTQTFNVFGYALTITATATSYDVDWGDGTWTRGVTSPGGPWPDGDVRHVYTVAGTYTVTVVEHWTGNWSVAGGGGGTVVGTLSTEGRIDAFPVEQLQAVRNR